MPVTRARPTTLFHYTTATGLLGILQSNTLHATHARFLNDGEELQYGLTVVREVLERCPAPPGVGVTNALLQEPFATIFVACFCETDDQLSQWRGYAPGETGYSIGFSTSTLPMDRLRLVHYKRSDQERVVRRAIERGVAPSTVEDFRIDSDESAARAWALTEELVIVATTLKHPTFADEREWRLVKHIPIRQPDGILEGDRTSVDVHFRPARRFVIPYVIEKLPTVEGIWGTGVLDLNSVRFGPTEHPKEAREALEWLLWSEGYKNHAELIKGSEVPLRV